MGFSAGYHSPVQLPKFVLYLAITLGWVSNTTHWLLCMIGVAERVDLHDLSSYHSVEICYPRFSASALKIKETLPLLKFGKYVERYNKMEEDDISCIICLSSFEKNDGIRELCNCGHIFHSKCLDGWIDHGQTTCPLCRRSMLPESEGLDAGNIRNDEVWEVQQMLYPFDSDLLVLPSD